MVVLRGGSSSTKSFSLLRFCLVWRLVLEIGCRVQSLQLPSLLLRFAFRVWFARLGAGFRVSCLLHVCWVFGFAFGFRDWAQGFRTRDAALRALPVFWTEPSGFRVQGSGFRVHGSALPVFWTEPAARAAGHVHCRSPPSRLFLEIGCRVSSLLRFGTHPRTSKG